MGCIVCKRPAEIAHCHGGSIVERMQEPKARGKKLARLDWLTLPLCDFHHRDTSPEGLDRNVRRWEERYGPQTKHLEAISKKLGIDVFDLAKPTKRIGAP